MINNLGIDDDNLKFVLRYTVYKDNNGSIVMTSSPSMNPISNNISVKYHWFRQHVEKEFLIWKIESENQKADIITKCLQGELFIRNRKLLCCW